jgi:hypothetical protein
MRRTLATLLVTAACALPATAQTLADYDYENLAFRGVGLDYGYVWPTRVEPAPHYAVRFDLGYLGPGVRIAPTLSYWSSRMSDAELARLATRLEQLPSVQQAGVTIDPADFGRIDWSALAAAIDAHAVWTAPLGVLTFFGAGAGVHLLNGRGDAIADTFVEDLLDTISAGISVFAGLEYPLTQMFRLYGEARYTLLSDIRYPGVRIGGAVMLPPRGAATPITRD